VRPPTGAVMSWTKALRASADRFTSGQTRHIGTTAMATSAAAAAIGTARGARSETSPSTASTPSAVSTASGAETGSQ